MAIQPVPEEQLRATQEALLRKALDDLPPIVNAEAATTAHDPQRLCYRGRWFTVPPIPYRRLLELTVLNQRIQRISNGLTPDTVPEISQLEALRDLVHATCDLMGTLIEWRWWQVRNPLADPEPEEFRALMDFFFAARTRSPVRAVHSTRAHPFFRQIWQTSSPSSPSTIPAGWSAASPAAADTTNSASPLSLMRD
jgi:hypothetical protein